MLTTPIANSLSITKKQHQWRERIVVENRDQQYVTVNKQSLLNFASNDYLQLANHPAVKKSFATAADIYGLGSGSSPAVSGYTSVHQALEEAFADFLDRDKALLFNSGYHANLAALTTFANRNTTIVADKHIHASIIDGALLSRATLHRYAHQDFVQAESFLKNNPSLLITESVFSMEGDITNIATLAQLANQYQSMLIVDDAHGVGVLGTKGKGACDYFGLSQQNVPCLITPFGKALGSMGAIISGSTELIDALLQSARSYRYSTAIPAAICAATLTALTLLQNESWRREQLQSLITHFNQEAAKHNLSLSSQDATPIRSILIGCNETVMQLQQYLMTKGFFVSAIRPPTVPKNTARIRVSLTCDISPESITQLLNHIAEYLHVHTS